MKTLSCALIVAIGVTPLSVRATEPFAGPRYDIGVTILDLNVGARNIGMGMTGVSSVRQPNSYYNPASVASADALALSFAFLDGPVDIDMTDTRLAYAFQPWSGSATDSWRVGTEIGFTTMKLQPQVVRTIFLPGGTGEMWQPNDYYLPAAAALSWERGGESIAVGASGKYLTLERPDEDSDSWLLDCGAIAAIECAIGGSTLRPRLGFSMTNLDSGIEIDSLEYTIVGQNRYGVGFDFDAPNTTTWGRSVAAASASFDVDFVDIDSNQSYWALGWELSVMRFVAARAGYQWFDREGRSSVTSLGAGIGWDFGSWLIRGDYAHSTPNGPAGPTLEFDRDVFGATLGARF